MWEIQNLFVLQDKMLHMHHQVDKRRSFFVQCQIEETFNHMREQEVLIRLRMQFLLFSFGCMPLEFKGINNCHWDDYIIVGSR